MSARVARLQPPRSPDIAKGHAIAIRMLRELRSDPDRLDGCFLDPQYRNAERGRGYENLVTAGLEEARRQGPGVEEGFAMVLSDFIATCCGGSTPKSGYYEQLMERGVIERAAGVVLEYR